MNRKAKLTILGCALAMLVATAIAAVPGIFSTVNVSTGYQMNGAAGTNGQVLCSDGTYFDTPCSVVKPGQYSGGSGYRIAPDGTIIEWGNSGSVVNDTATSITLPYTFPTGCYSVTATDSFLGGVSANWSAYSCGTTSFTIRPDGNTGAANWIAIGH